jgi:SAM-dependent methyltransferase
LVYCVAVLHHLETVENVRLAIHEMVRVTTPGGRIVIWDHNPLNPLWPILMKRWPQDHGDERLVPIGEIVTALALGPTTDVRYHRCGWMPECVPLRLMPIMSGLELLLEHTPLLRRWSAHNVVLATKR